MAIIRWNTFIFVISNIILLSITIFSITSIELYSSSKIEKNIDLEEERMFWAYNYIDGEYRKITATLLGYGALCYLYMEKECIQKLGEESVQTKVETICNEFDNTIFPRITDLAGHPNGTMGDIDDDPRIIILFLDNYNYYSEVNEIEHNVSNHCEMIYISYRLYHHNWLYPTIAHEFHHLIWFNNEWDEPPFTLEALAQYATYHAGYLGPYNNLVPQTSLYLSHPENSPLYWTDDLDYGSAYLFAFYIAEKYGVQILRDLINEPSDGPRGIEAVLKKSGYDISFNELFMNWITALTIDELGFQNDLYGFLGFDVRMTSYEIVTEIPRINRTMSISHYAFRILKLDSPPDNFTLIIHKLPEQVLGVSIAVHDSSGWQVQQDLHYEEVNTIINSFSGSIIEEAYIIMSYLSIDSPIAPQERGPGPSIDITNTLTEGIYDTSSPSSGQSIGTPTAGIKVSNYIGSSLMIIILTVIVYIRNKRFND